ncbi:MAG: MBL fold metallo-hydrolase [bacterium]
MVLKTLIVGPLEVNCYLIGDDKGGPIGIVDPGGDAKLILKAVEKLGRPVAYIVNTHGHFDHVGAVEELKCKLGVEYLIHKDERKVLEEMPDHMEFFGLEAQNPPMVSRYIEDGDLLTLGALTIKVIHTPGHSPGGVCLYSEETGQLISGDTLFHESVGRTDLPGGDTDTMLTSIAEKILTLPDQTRVFPGHGPETQIGHEKKFNPFL